MRYLISILFFLVIARQGVSQEAKTVKTPADLDSVEYDLRQDVLAPSSIQFPYRSIKVIDARYDTTKLGFEFNGKTNVSDGSNFKKIKITGGVGSGLAAFYNDYYQKCFDQSSNDLLIVFKTLWIENMPRRGKIIENDEFTFNVFQNVHVKVEFYIQQSENFHALKRVDTTFQLTNEIANAYALDLSKSHRQFALFMLAVKYLVEGYEFKDLIVNSSSRRKFSFSMIDSFNKKRFLLPILTDPHINHGVFTSFSGFTQNQPSILPGQYTIGKTDIIVKEKPYKLTDDDTISNKTYIAYADANGLHCDVAYHTDFVRTGNTFETFVDGYLRKRNRLKEMLVPRQFNLDTGKFY